MSRIKTIVNLIDPIDTLLDIGTDHGQVIIEAFLQNKINNAIAVDINKGPLKSAYKNIENNNFHTKTTFLQTDGFLDVNESFDGVIITGLGYKTIEHILKMSHKTPKFYILGAQRQLKELRQFLSNNNFKIIDEEVFYNRKDYVFIKIIKGSQQLTEKELFLGPILMNKKPAVNYYQRQLKSLKKIFKVTTSKNIINLENEINFIEEILLKLSTN